MITEGSIRAKIDSREKIISFIDSTSMNENDNDNDSEYIEVIEQLES